MLKKELKWSVQSFRIDFNGVALLLNLFLQYFQRRICGEYHK